MVKNWAETIDFSTEILCLDPPQNSKYLSQILCV